MNKTLAVLVISALLPAAQAFADKGEHSKKDIKLLNDSSAALASINPGLSEKLQKYASKESTEMESREAEKAEAGKGEKSEKKDIKMLRDAAKALKPSRPDLAKGLDRYAAKEQKEQREESSGREIRGDMGHEKTESPGGGGY